MIVSVPAPPPIVASPPPCPACNSTAMMRISASRIRMPTRIPYMRGARYLGYGGAHKLGPAAGIERCSAHQHTVQLRFRQELGGILQVHAAAVENQERCRARRVGLQPAANGAVHVGRVFRCGVASGTDGPYGLIGNRHTTFGPAPASREGRLELPRDDRQGLARFALCQRLADTQHRLQIGRKRGLDLLARFLVRLAENVAALRMADQGQASAGLSGERPRDGASERALGLPINVLCTDEDVAMTGDTLSDRLDRHGWGKKPHRPLARNLT